MEKTKIKTQPALPRQVKRPLIFTAGVAFMLIFASFIPGAVRFIDKTAPVIDVWYGQRQSFGKAGISQRWVNVLGNAADAESQISSMSYQLNGDAPVTMRMGPDQRRLENSGDFNVEISTADLHAGDNQLKITATNGAGLTTTSAVTLNYQPTIVALPFKIDWSKVSNAQDVLQIVDGKWKWDASGIRPVELGYDRFLTLGDYQWINYQVTVPITVHGIDQVAFDRKKGGEHAGISVDLRWVGHSDVPVKCPPPHCGWNPVGDFNKYWFEKEGTNFLGLKVKEKEENFPTVPYKFDAGDTYIFKVSVQTTPQGNLYRMKVWEQSSESEPTWMFQRTAPIEQGPLENPGHGAIALVAHHTDVTIGNILVEPLP